MNTPQGKEYDGKRFNGKVCACLFNTHYVLNLFPYQICGVAILRAGEVLEPGLSLVCKDATIGKILIQTNEGTGEPELHFLRLPQNIADCHVILMDATIATGAAAIMAIQVLLVCECTIILVMLH